MKKRTRNKRKRKIVNPPQAQDERLEPGTDLEAFCLQRIAQNKLVSLSDMGDHFTTNFAPHRVRGVYFDWIEAVFGLLPGNALLKNLSELWMQLGLERLNRMILDPKLVPQCKKEMAHFLETSHLSVRADPSGNNVTIQRLFYIFPEIMTNTLHRFAEMAPTHIIREGMHYMPGMLSWVGAAAIIPNECINLQVLHQIWCLKHELRFAESGKPLPLTADVMKMWQHAFKSSTLAQEFRRQFCSRQLVGSDDDIDGDDNCFKDAEFLVLEKHFNLHVASIDFSPSENIKDTLHRLEDRSFYNFYKNVFNATERIKTETDV